MVLFWGVSVQVVYDSATGGGESVGMLVGTLWGLCAVVCGTSFSLFPFVHFNIYGFLHACSHLFLVKGGVCMVLLKGTESE